MVLFLSKCLKSGGDGKCCHGKLLRLMLRCVKVAVLARWPAAPARSILKNILRKVENAKRG
ncbi:MAG: hypothetical protein DDT29_01270 [Dehalococcoidia bacterium]|nr:hypothetical protein [Bacillota bacterium]